MKRPDPNDIMRKEGAAGVIRLVDNAKPSHLIVSSRDFVSSYVPPCYAIEGVLQQRRLYSLTGRTGDGKTAVKLCFARHMADGLPLAGLEVERCRVLYMAGENPDDVRARWIAMGEHMGFDPDTIDVHFAPGVFKVSEMLDAISDEVRALGGVGAVMVDTSAAYFEGDAENDNVQAGNHARMLRRLTSLLDGPCVIVGCHPTKVATNDMMLPRGGGAFLAEVDGNLTCIATDHLVEVHWAGKFRGPDFDPLSFEISSVTTERLKDSKGRTVWTAIAHPIGSARHAAIEDEARSKQDEVLLVLDQSPDYSLAQIAEALGWHSTDKEGKQTPYKMKVKRACDGLKVAKLAVTDRGKWELTDRGKKVAKRMRSG
jgi:hypothetical protein